MGARVTPSGSHRHRLSDATEKGDHRSAGRLGDAAEREPEAEREDDERQHRSVGRGLYRVRRHEAHEPARKSGELGTLHGGGPGADGARCGRIDGELREDRRHGQRDRMPRHHEETNTTKATLPQRPTLAGAAAETATRGATMSGRRSCDRVTHIVPRARHRHGPVRRATNRTPHGETSARPARERGARARRERARAKLPPRWRGIPDEARTLLAHPVAMPIDDAPALPPIVRGGSSTLAAPRAAAGGRYRRG